MTNDEIRMTNQPVGVQFVSAKFPMTPVLRYSEEPDFAGNRPGSSGYLRTGVQAVKAALFESATALCALVSSFFIRISSLFRYSRFRYSLFVALVLAGCTESPSVDLTPINSRHHVHINFSRAYFAPNQSGEDQIILLSDPIDEPTRTTNDGALKPATAPPLWQVLSIELHWRTSRSPRVDSLVATNAVLHWYVYGKPTATGVGVLHYVGTGSVSISTDSTGADVTVNHSDLKLADQHGYIKDPFGQFQISTSFRAQTSKAHVQQSLDDIAKAISEADQK